MKGTLRVMFFTVEVNLILWLSVAGMLFAAQVQDQTIKTAVLVGAVFAAIAQHWAYYAVYKRAKQM